MVDITLDSYLTIKSNVNKLGYYLSLFVEPDNYTIRLAKEVDRLSRFMQKLLIRGRVDCEEYTEISTVDGEAILINANFEGERVNVSYIKANGEPPMIVATSDKYSSVEVSIPGLDAFSIRSAPIIENDLT